MIRVGIVEDQTLVREGLRALLQLAADIEIVFEATDGADALDKVATITADIVLLDMRMPRMNGLEFLQSAGAAGRLPPTIILTTFDDDELVIGGIRAGAKGYLLKDVSLKQLVTAIQCVAAGGTLIQPVLTERIRQGMARGISADVSERLTQRETEILRLMAAGYSNQEIAAALDLAEGTVKNHVSAILAKLGVGDRTRAVLKAIEQGHI